MNPSDSAHSAWRKTLRKTMGQFLLFSMIGAIGTLGHYLTLIVLVEGVQQSPAVATTAGFVVGALINYILNYRFTFRSTRRHRDTLGKFMFIALIGAGINYGIMLAGTRYSSLHYLLVQLGATAIVLVWNYSLNRLWTFATTQHPDTE